MVERAINDPVPFLLVQVGHWACALAILLTLKNMGWPGYVYLLLENYGHLCKLERMFHGLKR